MNCPRNLIPVLLGGDLNAYSVALSFKESFNVNSHVFTRYRCGATENSRFITTHLCSDISDSSIALTELLSFAAKHSGACLILIPCSDSYLELVYSVRSALEGLYHILVPDEEHYFSLTDKAQFYSLLKKHKLPYPESYCITKNDIKRIPKIDISYPAVLKPSRSAEYNSFHFCGQKKVYFVNSPNEAMKVADMIYASGYENKIIIQQKISDSAKSYVLTTLSNNEGRVVRAALGKVLMLERTDTGYGNYSSIISTPIDALSLSLIDTLNKISYKGIANFDILRDKDSAYCLDFNARQGRSCDYLRGAGIRLAEYFVKSAIYKEKYESDFCFSESFWHYPSLSIALKNLEDCSEYDRVIKLARAGKSYSPFKNPYDGLLKKAYSIIHNMRVSKRLNKAKRIKNEAF